MSLSNWTTCSTKKSKSNLYSEDYAYISIIIYIYVQYPISEDFPCGNFSALRTSHIITSLIRGLPKFHVEQDG